AGNYYAIASGANAQTTGLSSVAIGGYVVDSSGNVKSFDNSNNPVAAVASGDYAIAVGPGAQAIAHGATALGVGAKATQQNTV
ncbi:hypothetical protein M1199_23480, partial [Salmonella enterica subsp. enterica serovar Oranienburg]